jgi:hypothetical protein
MIGSRLKWIIGTGCILLIIGYGIYQARFVLVGPRIDIVSPEDGDVFSDPLIRAEGEVNNVARLFINGRQVFTDEAGNFSDTLLLEEGYNIIELRAEDRFGRTQIKTREVVFSGTFSKTTDVPPEKTSTSTKDTTDIEETGP